MQHSSLQKKDTIGRKCTILQVRDIQWTHSQLVITMNHETISTVWKRGKYQHSLYRDLLNKYTNKRPVGFMRIKSSQIGLKDKFTIFHIFLKTTVRCSDEHENGFSLLHSFPLFILTIRRSLPTVMCNAWWGKNLSLSSCFVQKYIQTFMAPAVWVRYKVDIFQSLSISTTKFFPFVSLLGDSESIFALIRFFDTWLDWLHSWSLILASDKLINIFLHKTRNKFCPTSSIQSTLRTNLLMANMNMRTDYNTQNSTSVHFEHLNSVFKTDLSLSLSLVISYFFWAWLTSRARPIH